MITYEDRANRELGKWKIKMSKKPTLINRMTKGIQRKTNDLIPENAHRIITNMIKNMIKAVLFGSEILTGKPLKVGSLEERENKVRERLDFYRKAAAVSGAGTGFGGFLIGLADFPILLSLKIKFLYDTAGIYGFDVRDYRERLYILYVFQLAFCSDEKRLGVYRIIRDWEENFHKLPEDIDEFDWRSFQEEYRDYVDLVKLLQLVPGLGSIAGAYGNYKLLNKLGETAINAYRLRVLK